MKNRKGFILLLTLIFMTVLTVFTGSLMYMATADMRNSAPQSNDVNMSGLADAGLSKARMAISDDYLGLAPSPGSRTGVADLRGGDASLSSSVSNQDNMRYVDSSNATINNNNDLAIVRTFDSNYTNTRIVSVVPRIRASRATGGQGATIVFAYTTDGTNYTTVLTQVLPSSTTIVDYAGSAIAGLTWNQIMSSNFRLRAIRTAGNRNVNIDAMYLRVTYGIDTLKELWATGGYATFPIPLSSGNIQSITITDEAGKLNLNYATQAMISSLFTSLGVSSASTKATAVINYLANKTGHHFFDNMEELQKVPGILSADCDIILDRNHTKGYITASVYSYINQNVYTTHPPTPSTPAPAPSVRPPVNINTAPFEVLKAIFDPPLALGSGDSTTLANAIITFRNATPFTCFYTSDATVTTDFIHFVQSQTAYLTAAEQNTVIDNADASYLAPVSGFINAAQTTEFCYAGNVFYISGNDTGPVVNNSGLVVKLGSRKFYLKTLAGNDGSRAFYTYAASPMPPKVGWRKESFDKPLP